MYEASHSHSVPRPRGQSFATRCPRRSRGPALPAACGSGCCGLRFASVLRTALGAQAVPLSLVRPSLLVRPPHPSRGRRQRSRRQSRMISLSQAFTGCSSHVRFKGRSPNVLNTPPFFECLLDLRPAYPARPESPGCRSLKHRSTSFAPGAVTEARLDT